jgi:hypothetical protein
MLQADELIGYVGTVSSLSRNTGAPVSLLHKETQMTPVSRTAGGFVQSAVLVLGLFYAAGAVTQGQRGQSITNQRVMLINAQTGKCLTIAGGRSTDNNVTALQFDCDSDPSRTWRIRPAGQKID